jgi:hypothetical protein
LDVGRRKRRPYLKEKKISINYHEAKEIINDYDIIDSVQYIKLEDTDNLIGEVRKMIITPNEYLLWDNQNKWIWIFDKSGKYRNKITNFGLGPDEYSSIVNFFF